MHRWAATLNAAVCGLSRCLGPIRSFRPTEMPGRFVYVQKAPGHTEQTIAVSFRYNRLIQLDGATEMRDFGGAVGAAVLYEHRFHRLIQMPKRADPATLRLRVTDGVLVVTIREGVHQNHRELGGSS